MKTVSKMKIERTKLGLTQLQVCELAKVTHKTLIKIESGEIDTAKVETLKKIAKALNTNIVDLFFEEKKNNKNT